MNLRHTAPLRLAVLVAFTSTAVAGDGSIDHDNAALRVIDHDRCRVIVPPRNQQNAMPSAGGCSDTDVIDVLWYYTGAALAVADGERDQQNRRRNRTEGPTTVWISWQGQMPEAALCLNH